MLDDDIIQDMLFQITQIDLEESPVSLESHSESADTRKARKDVDGNKESATKPSTPIKLR